MLDLQDSAADRNGQPEGVPSSRGDIDAASTASLCARKLQGAPPCYDHERSARQVGTNVDVLERQLRDVDPNLERPGIAALVIEAARVKGDVERCFDWDSFLQAEAWALRVVEALNANVGRRFDAFGELKFKSPWHDFVYPYDAFGGDDVWEPSPCC